MEKQNLSFCDQLPVWLTLANRLEDEGQYNLAKQLNAAAESLTRRAAYEMKHPPLEREDLIQQVETAVEMIGEFDINTELVDALQTGLAAMKEERLPSIEETPNPYVCRTCGHVEVGAAIKCPVCGAWPETFQEILPVYWLEELDPIESISALRHTPFVIQELMQDLPEKVLRQPDGDGGWSIREILLHLRDAQELLETRVDQLINREKPVFDPQALFSLSHEDQESQSTQSIFAEYRQSRLHMVPLLEGIPLKSWWNSGLHKEFGQVTLHQQVSYFALHEITHLPKIQELRKISRKDSSTRTNCSVEAIS